MSDPARNAQEDKLFSWAEFLFTVGCLLILASITKPLIQLGIWAVRAVGVIP